MVRHRRILRITPGDKRLVHTPFNQVNKARAGDMAGSNGRERIILSIKDTCPTVESTDHFLFPPRRNSHKPLIHVLLIHAIELFDQSGKFCIREEERNGNCNRSSQPEWLLNKTIQQLGKSRYLSRLPHIDNNVPWGCFPWSSVALLQWPGRNQSIDDNWQNQIAFQKGWPIFE